MVEFVIHFIHRGEDLVYFADHQRAGLARLQAKYVIGPITHAYV